MVSGNVYYGNSTSPVTAIDLYACRACLVTDIKLFHIHKCGLAEIFAAVTSEAVPINDGFPQHLCHYCVALVHKFATFKRKCERSHGILQTALLLKQPITTDYLRIIDREAENLKFPLTIHDAVLIDCRNIEEAMVAEKDIKEEVTLEMEKEVTVLPTSTNIRADYELPSQLYVFNNGSDAEVREEDEPGITLKLEAECDNDGSAMSTDHMNCEDKEDDMPLSTICSRNNVVDLADDVTELIGRFRAEYEEQRTLDESEHSEKILNFEGAGVVQQQSNENANEAIKISVKKRDTESKQQHIGNTIYEEINKTKQVEATENELNIDHIYQCDICNKSFKFKASIIVHLKRHRLHLDKSINMNKLKEGLSRKIQRETEMGKKIHKSVKDNPSLRRISQRTNDKKRYQCDQCPYYTIHLCRLKYHSRTHTGEKPFACDICSFKTANKSNLNAHRKNHTGEKPFSCDICSFRTGRKNNLIAHTRRHTGEKPFTCNICGFKTGRNTALIVHTRIHTGEKPFACDYCSFNTGFKSDLIRHTRIHTGEKPFSCNVCSFKTGHKSVLKAHTKKHTGEDLFTCDFCSYKTGYKNALIAHIEIHTADKLLTCDIGSFKTGRKRALITHTKKHTRKKLFTCDFCNYNTGHQSNLIRHTRKHTGEKLFACRICPYRTTDNSNLVRHTNKKHS